MIGQKSDHVHRVPCKANLEIFYTLFEMINHHLLHQKKKNLEFECHISIN